VIEWHFAWKEKVSEQRASCRLDERTYKGKNVEDAVREKGKTYLNISAEI